MLPAGHTIVGLDEHTGLVIDFETRKCKVHGISSVTLLREYNPKIHPAGKVFPLEELGEVRCPELLAEGIPAAAWEMVQNAVQVQDLDEAPAEVARLAEDRNQARFRKDWEFVDGLRQQIEVLGWTIQDTPEGQKIVRRS